MSREDYRAGREALQEVLSHPERERPHESAIASFVAGLTYEERRHDEDRTEKTGKARTTGKSGKPDHPS